MSYQVYVVAYKGYAYEVYKDTDGFWKCDALPGQKWTSLGEAESAIKQYIDSE